MATYEISRDQWVAFFETFTSNYAGRLVSIGAEERHTKREIVGIEPHELPLNGIAADFIGRENFVAISVGLSKDRILRHIIQAVVHIRVIEAENGSVLALEIESINGHTTTLILSVPMPLKTDD